MSQQSLPSQSPPLQSSQPITQPSSISSTALPPEALPPSSGRAFGDRVQRHLPVGNKDLSKLFGASSDGTLAIRLGLPSNLSVADTFTFVQQIIETACQSSQIYGERVDTVLEFLTDSRPSPVQLSYGLFLAYDPINYYSVAPDGSCAAKNLHLQQRQEDYLKAHSESNSSIKGFTKANVAHINTFEDRDFEILLTP